MEKLLNAKKIILESNYLIALTGAGISAESGIPIFRGPNGLWRKYKPEELATPQAFARNPRLVWEWYAWRISIVLKAKPNPAHFALSELEKQGILKFLITQNVDDLHERAGTRNLVKLHGDILTVLCTNCGYRGRLKEVPDEIPPKCPECKYILRPGVVWFGESLPPRELNKAFEEAEKADAILVVGTSGVVMPAGAIPNIVKRNGGYVIEVNLSESAITPYADVFLKGKAGIILPKLMKLIRS